MKKMNGAFFLHGLLIGLSVAAVVGPMSILCMQRTLRGGYLYGMISGLGIATADALYGSVAAFGLTVIGAVLVHHQGWLHLCGGLFLIYLGIKAVFSKPAARAVAAQAHNLLGAYVSTFLLTITNPLTILSFAAIFAGLGVGSASQGILPAILVVCGVFSGSSLWWFLLTSSISALRKRLSAPWLMWINRLSGAVLTLFGLAVLLSMPW
jgi:threonine/homoserine/homoserine lactone efflux protein